jgi:HSP20 family molecular chaperone IbpA
MSEHGWFVPNKNTGVTTLDVYDGFDELDNVMGKNYFWITKPEFLNQSYAMTPRVPQKYRIMLDCSGFTAKNIKVEHTGRKLFISGKEENRVGSEDYSVKDFKKCYDVPQQAELEKIVSFMTATGYLVVEFPLKETASHPHADLIPKILDTTNGCKTMTLKLSFPDNIDQTKIWLFIKDRDLIIKTEDMSQKHHTHARFFYYKRAVLPENTDFDLLKCTFENNKLVVTAPLKTEYKSFRSVPLEFKKQH